MSAAPSQQSRLRPTLGMLDLVVYGMVYMLPIAPFALFGIVYDASHGLVPLAYTLGALMMLFTARSYALLSVEFPVAGSAYTYARFGIGEYAGFIAGWLILLDYIIAPGLLYIVAAAALNGLVPTIARWEWILGFVLVGTGINLVGVKFTAAANRYMLIAMLIVLGTFIAVGLLALHAGRGNAAMTMGSLFDVKRFSWSSMGAAVLISSVNFLGFDAITTLGEEVTAENRKSLGTAGFLTLGLILMMFVAQTWIASDLMPGSTILSADTAFYDVARYAGGNGLFMLTTVATALSWGLACAIVCQTGISRILFAMGRDRQLPHILSKVHPRTRQPYVANLFVGVVSLVIALGFSNHLDEIVLAQNFGALNAFLLVNLAVIGHFWFKRKSGRFFAHVVIPICGFLIIAGLLTSMRAATLKLGFAWLSIGIVYRFVNTRVLERAAISEA